MAKKTFGTKEILATINLAKDNGITIFYSDGLATLELPKGYLYNGSTGLTLDVYGLMLFQAWYQISLDVKELVDNKDQWIKQ